MPAAPDVDPLSILSRLEALGIKLGLERARAVLTAMGEPQRRFPAVLVAGTNGKGSTSAFLAAIAQAAGYRTGLYTSPHLEFVEERLRIDGRTIEPGRFGRLLQDLVDLAERETGVPPTYFEAVTLAAFQWFAEEEVDLAVVEVGLGGRLDATNLCDPILSLITPIGFDHQEYLGDTLAAIAREKAGILRPGKPALVWIEEPEAAESVRAGRRRDRRRSPLRLARGADRGDRAGRAGRASGSGSPRRSAPTTWRSPCSARTRRSTSGWPCGRPRPSRSLGFDRIGPDAIREGAAACRWPGRLEAIELPGGRRILLDAAHNEAGARVLAEFLDRMGQPVDLLFGVLADKDYAGMLGLLAPRARRIVLTTPASPRAKDPAELAALLAGHPGEVFVEPDRERALDRALGLGGEVLVACGSIFLIGEVRTRVIHQLAP